MNNMLAGIIGTLFLATKSVQDRPVTLQKLHNIEQLSFRAADMIKQLLTFARKDRVEIKQLPFTSFIKEALKFLSTSVPENITVQQHLRDENLSIKGDATQLHQILMNLVNNARDAVEGSADPCISIHLESFQTDKAFLKPQDPSQKNDDIHGHGELILLADDEPYVRKITAEVQHSCVLSKPIQFDALQPRHS